MKVLLLVLVACLGSAVAKRLCQNDADCEVLGSLKCIFSQCETWGVCGCERGYYSRFLGSERNFACVPARKVGESCSTDWEEGVCAAEHSQCKHGVCQCDLGYENRWGSEKCLLIQDQFYASESCSDNHCEAGTTCTSGKAWRGNIAATAANEPYTTLANTAFDEGPRTCDCGEGYHTIIPNYFSSAYFMGRKRPICTRYKIGDKCTKDVECAHIKEPNNGGNGWTAGAAVCDSNGVCACKDTAHKPDITGQFCAKPLGAGAACLWKEGVTDTRDGVCNGEIGLRCGDPCDLTEWNADRNFTCVCDPGWTKSGSACSRATEGTPCSGDFQCKSLDYNAICEYGACTNSAITLATALLVTLLPVFTVWMTS